MQMNIKIDSKDFNKGLDDLAKKQLPFVVAKTLTDLARMGQFTARVQTRKAFKLHTDFIPNNIRYTPARKTDFFNGTAHSIISTTEKLGFMVDQETGDTRRPIGKAFAVPSILAKRLNDFKTSTGSVKAKYKPKNLLKAWNAKTKTHGTIQNTNKVNAYIAGGILFARIKNLFMTGKRKSIPLDAFEGSVKIKPRWGFIKSIEERTKRMVESTFRNNLKQAINSVKIP